MKYIFTFFAIMFPCWVIAQSRQLIEIDANSFAPVQTDVISGVAIDKIGLDSSRRPCSRIKMHINRMTKAEIEGLSVRPIGGNVVVMKQEVAAEGNGLIVELTAKEQTRFFLHHDKYGDSNEVSLNLEGDKEYKLEAMLNTTHSIVISSNTVGADVYIDNVFKGQIGEGFSLTVGDVYPGSHTIRIQQGSLKSEQIVEVSNLNIHFRVNINHTQARPQYVIFQVNPKNAGVVIDGKSYIPDEYGYVTAVLNNGSYLYSITSKDYHEEKGSFVVNGIKVEKSISLRPAYGWLKVLDQGELKDASVYVDGVLIGTTPITSDKLSSGVHTIRIVKKLYKTHEDKVTIEDNTTREYTPDLIADFANVTLSAGTDCNIYVNNEYKGKSPWNGNLATGAYIIEARKEGHRTTSISKTISASPSKQNYNISAPTPIIGSLDIKSTPAMADVYINDKLVGKTPLMHDIIIGKHTVSIRKEGFANKTEYVTVEEGKTKEVNITLTEKKAVSSSTNKTIKVHYLLNETAYVYIDGKLAGVTGKEISVPYGLHNVVVKHDGKFYGEKIKVDKYSSTLIYMTGAPRVSGIYSECAYDSTTSTSNSSTTDTKVWAKVNYYDGDALVYVDGKYQGSVGHLFPLQSDMSYYIVVKSKYGGMLYGKTIRTDNFHPNIHNVINMNGAPKVKSLYTATSSSSSSVYGSSYKKKYKKYRSWDSFNLGVFADLALISYDDTLFGLGIGLNWRLWRYNSIFIPTIGVRYMYGFDGTHAVGFPIIINGNWCAIFGVDNFSCYMGIGIEPVYIKNYTDYYESYGTDVRYGVTSWDYAIVLNILGFGWRHHDFNAYLNFGLKNDDNLSIGLRYSYFF